jgi:peroxiredoxin
MKRIALLFAAAVMAFSAVSGCTKEKEKAQQKPKSETAALPAAEGKPAPDFSLKGSDGNVTLSALKGNVVLVHFWATWCPPCLEELPSLAKLNTQMAGKPFRLLAVSIDTDGDSSVQKLFGKLKINIPALYDMEGNVSKQYGITGVPETFIVSPDGTIIKKVVGSMDWTSPDVATFLNDAMKPAR